MKDKRPRGPRKSLALEKFKEELLTINQVAGLFDVTIPTVARWTDSELIYAAVFGSTRYYLLSEIKEAIEDQINRRGGRKK